MLNFLVFLIKQKNVCQHIGKRVFSLPFVYVAEHEIPSQQQDINNSNTYGTDED